MDIEELYDYMSELLEQAIEITGDESISSPYEAIDALTDLMEEENYNTVIGDIIDEISYTMEDIDSMEAQDYFENEEDIYESRKSNKKVIKLTETQIDKLKKIILLERVCPKGLVFDENLDSCVKTYELDELEIIAFRDDKDGKIKEAYREYFDLFLKIDALYKLNDMVLDAEYKYDSDNQKPSVKLFNDLSKKIKEKYKEEYENFDSVRRERFVEDEVRPMVGKPYVYGEEGPEFFDCSGLICAVFEQGRRTADSYYNMADIFTDINQLKVGDIVFFDYDPENKEDKKPIDHVGIISSIKGSKIKMIHASGDPKCTLDKYKKDKLPKKCKVKEVNYSSFWRRNTKGFGRFVGFEY